MRNSFCKYMLISLGAMLMPVLDASAQTAPAPDIQDFKLEPPKETVKQPAGPQSDIPPPQTVELATAKPVTTEPVTVRASEPAIKALGKATAEQKTKAIAARPVAKEVEPKKSTVVTETVAKTAPAAEPMQPDTTVNAPASLDESSEIIAQSSVPSQMSATASMPPLFWVAIGGAVALLLGLIGWLFQRRRIAVAVLEDGDLLEEQPVDALPEPEIAPAHFAPPQVAPVHFAPAAAAAPALTTVTSQIPSPPLARAEIEIVFQPEAANFGEGMFILRGTLRLANIGKATATGLRLHSTMMSANQRQAESIAMFQDRCRSEPGETVPDLAPGERLQVSLEMQLPMEQMQSMNVAGRELLVPVVAMRLDYSGAGVPGDANAQYAGIVGREPKVAGDKMGAIRIDLGPRTVQPLAQRSIFA
jgi:hypothetical protein